LESALLKKNASEEGEVGVLLWDRKQDGGDFCWGIIRWGRKGMLREETKIPTQTKLHTTGNRRREDGSTAVGNL